MSVFTSIRQRKGQSKVHYSQYIKTENKPDGAGVNSAEPATPEQLEVK